MLDFDIIIDPATQKKVLRTSITGKPLLTTPQLNKGTAFTKEERRRFHLIGKLPIQIETLGEQVKRAYQQYRGYETSLQRNIYLNNLNDKNQVLFYKLLSEHLDELLPTIYTPIVGTAVKKFSHEFRQPRGLYITYEDKGNIESILKNRSNPNIDIVVVTDGEGVLGIGDQGVGGMDIPVAKLMVYTICGGIDPCRTLPVFLDVGTNNEELRNDSFYLGLRQARITGKDYDDFIHEFVEAVRRACPHAFLHWEDFGRGNARNILDRFQDKLCTFNDDIQGTGVVTLSALLAATHVTQSDLGQQRIIVYGAGSAGTGIADQILDAMIKSGVDETQAVSNFWLIDRQGLLFHDDDQLTESQRPYARHRNDIADWSVANKALVTLEDTVNHVKPTVLIGCSAAAEAFSEVIIKTMASHVERPIIFPLSNPTECAEATPKQLMEWTQGKALIATGTGFPPVEYQGEYFPIAQCNNALAFPGIGLGILAVGAKHLSDHMLWRACIALSECSPSKQDSHAPLLPSLADAQTVAKKMALAVAEQAIEENAATQHQQTDLVKVIDDIFWEPRYLPYELKE